MAWMLTYSGEILSTGPGANCKRNRRLVATRSWIFPSLRSSHSILPGAWNVQATKLEGLFLATYIHGLTFVCL